MQAVQLRGVQDAVVREVVRAGREGLRAAAAAVFPVVVVFGGPEPASVWCWTGRVAGS